MMPRVDMSVRAFQNSQTGATGTAASVRGPIFLNKMASENAADTTNRTRAWIGAVKYLKSRRGQHWLKKSSLRSDFLSQWHQIFLVSMLVFVACIASASEFPAPYNSETDMSIPLMPAADAAAQFKVPDGFKTSLFASEPDVQNPIGMAWDARGRLWVAENYTYAERPKRFDLNLRDRVLIFEDKNGDGHFSSRKVFTDNVQMLTSVEVGFGGVWLMCPPQLLFIPDANGDDIPDGPPQVVLDGFDVPQDNYHNFANGLRWGPDGWLYGRCGASAPGKIGAPGTPAGQRVPVTGGIWRYHPRKKTFEVLSHGTTNPWGHDWNEFGEAFFVNTVNGHLWHVIPGAHFVRPHTLDPNPYCYTQIDMHADHWHFDTGKSWMQSRDGKADAYGGGHAHCGAMVYLGDNWPAEYRGRLFTINFHGRRLNTERLDREGSGYVGKREPDIMFSADRWFRGIDLGYGPDGGVFVLDWSDTGECHESTGVHRTSGRIFKITYGTPKAPAITDLTKLSASELVKLHEHPNEWFCRMARMQLAERAASGKSLDSAPGELKAMVQKHPDPVVRVRALCTLYAIGAADESWLATLLRDDNEHIRVWAIRFLTDALPLDTVFSQRPAATASGAEEKGADAQVAPALLNELTRMAREDTSGLVRLTLSSTLQRLSYSQRVGLAEPLLAHTEDSNDHNLPLMLWYGLIPVGSAAPSELARLGAHCQLPQTRRLIARRLAESQDSDTTTVNTLLESAYKTEPFLEDVLSGLSEGFKGRRKAAKPAIWDTLATQTNASQNSALRDRVRDLSVLFGDGRALDEVKHIALDNGAELSNRRTALLTLIESKPPDLKEICEKLLSVRFLNAIAVKGLAQFEDPGIGAQLAKTYKNFDPGDRRAVIEVLVSRPTFAKPLLEEIAAKHIPRSDITPFHARQLLSFNDEALSKRLEEVWGQVRREGQAGDQDKHAFMSRLKAKFTTAIIAQADKSQGRAVFSKVCATCHTLYGEGGHVGPDLTGAGRDNMDYLLENIVDPSLVVNVDFRMSVVALKDGRVLNGIMAAQTDKTITLQTMTERITLERENVKKIALSPQSLMPEGLLEALPPEQVRDLFAYLMCPTQVALPEGRNRIMHQN